MWFRKSILFQQSTSTSAVRGQTCGCPHYHTTTRMGLYGIIIYMILDLLTQAACMGCLPSIWAHLPSTTNNTTNADTRQLMSYTTPAVRSSQSRRPESSYLHLCKLEYVFNMLLHLNSDQHEANARRLSPNQQLFIISCMYTAYSVFWIERDDELLHHSSKFELAPVSSHTPKPRRSL